MSNFLEDFGKIGKIEFDKAKTCLLPNEEITFVCEIQDGFLVLTDRRLVVIATARIIPNIERAVPLDCVIDCVEEKDGLYKIVGATLDQFGQFESGSGDSSKDKIHEVVIKISRRVKGENREETRTRFVTTMNRFNSALRELREFQPSDRDLPLQRDYAYLENLPPTLTHNAILDLNNILQDMPIPNALYHEAQKFLGEDYFILEESLRDGDSPENGILLAAGSRGYIWIQGKKKGRYMENILVDKVEWNNIGYTTFRWQSVDGTFEVNYVLQIGGKELRVPYLWSPRITKGALQFLWLYQELNGPWILTDIMCKYSGRPMPASIAGITGQGDDRSRCQRYFY